MLNGGAFLDIKRRMNYKKILYSMLCLGLWSLFMIGGNSFANGVVQASCPDGLTTCPTLAQCDCTEARDSVLQNTGWSCWTCKTNPNPSAIGNSSDTISLSGCTATNSSLFWDLHAENDFGDQSCSCIKGYGELNGHCLPCSDPWVCCGVKLNTNVPFIGNCIETKAQDAANGLEEGSAFPILMWSLVKILITVILIASFVMIVIAGVMISTWGANVAAWRKMIMSVVIALAVLWALGVILRLINPNFFG